MYTLIIANNNSNYTIERAVVDFINHLAVGFIVEIIQTLHFL